MKSRRWRTGDEEQETSNKTVLSSCSIQWSNLLQLHHWLPNNLGMIFIVVLWLKLKVAIHDPLCTNHKVVRGRMCAVVWCWNSCGHRIGITLSTKHRFTECWRIESIGTLLNCVWYNNIHLVLFSVLQLYVIVAVLLFCLQIYLAAPLFTNLMIFISVKWQNLLSGAYVYSDCMAY